MHPSTSMIKVAGISKRFGPVTAVDDVSVEIARDEFFAILGPSGCGKTTLLRLLAGFEMASAGEIYIDGEPVAGVPANKRPTNMVFQNYAIFPHLNVRENIGYGLLNKKMAQGELDREVDSMLELIRLSGYGKRAAHQLSGGERQRVALARALVCRPKVLLLDEPLGALDKKLREEMQVELRQLQRAVGITFVFVTHDQEEALTMADRIAVMVRGKVVQVDSSAALYEAPVNTTVAEFIGNINLVSGTVESVGDTVVLDAGPAGRLTAPKGRSEVRRGDKAVLAVRPEKLRLAKTAPGTGQNGVRGQLATEAYAGDRSYYFLLVPGLPRHLMVASLNDRPSLARTSSRHEEDVWAVWPIDSGFLLTS